MNMGIEQYLQIFLSLPRTKSYFTQDTLYISRDKRTLIGPTQYI